MKNPITSRTPTPIPHLLKKKKKEIKTKVKDTSLPLWDRNFQDTIWETVKKLFVFYCSVTKDRKLCELYNWHRWRVSYIRYVSYRYFSNAFSKGITIRTKLFILRRQCLAVKKLISKDVFILLDLGRGKMWHFQVITVLNVFETRPFAKADVPLRSSKTTCNTSTASFWELGSNGTFWILDILCLKTHRKVDRSIAFVALFWMDILKVVAFEMCDVMKDSDNILFQRIGAVFNACKLELV